MGPGTSEEAVSADYYEFKADAAAKVVTAKALLGVVGSFKFMLALTIFRDILTQLNLVSKAFQKAHVYYNDAREILASVKAGLTAQYLTPDFVGGEDDELHSIMDGLETRFPDDDKLSALCIFDFTRLPSTQEQWDASKTDFGLDEVDTLLKHFGTVQITSTRRYERFSRVTRWWPRDVARRTASAGRRAAADEALPVDLALSG
ncbi:hypothetical protein JL721_6935 [Aureococcus anophagefferens]|nr:hypothetical protein JL721_6935 [Aureococcus anophagefferens]